MEDCIHHWIVYSKKAKCKKCGRWRCFKTWKEVPKHFSNLPEMDELDTDWNEEDIRNETLSLGIY